MRYGLAMPLALATLGGVLTGYLALPGMIQALGLALLVLLAGRWHRAALLVAVGLLIAMRLLLVEGGELAPGLTRQDLLVEGRLSEVRQDGRVTRLRLEVARCRPRAAGLPDCDDLTRVRLNAYDAPTMQPGERWRFAVRLRPPAGFANPETFDYRAWLWREGLQATGYVRVTPPPRRLSEAGTALRERALARLDVEELAPRPARWLAALSLGADERLVQADWDLLNASGTTHLMVISGLHVGLVATFALWLARGLARCLSPAAWRLAAWPWWCAGAAAVGYAGLAGLAPPALRAMIMALVGLWVASGRHSPGPWQACWLALALVLLVDPLSAWRPGLWLSFAAVALLILIWQGRPRPQGWRGWLWALGRTQLLLAPLMAALVLLAFTRLAPVAPLVNLLAVPLVSSLMVPLGLLGWLLAWAPPLATACWGLFALLAEGLSALLELAVGWLPLWWPEASQVIPLALALGGIGVLWALPGLAGRLRLAGTLLLATLPLWPASAELGPGELRVRVFDVGQGQLVELRTAHYRALVDTGPRFASGFAPLTSLWPPGQRFDDVIVSHGDRDHAGGLPALLERHRIERLLAPPNTTLEMAHRDCVAGQAWRRDGVQLRILWPPAGIGGLSDNDRSCVLEVSIGDHRLLITGDVSRAVERTFLPAVQGPLTALVAGHHGSRTSSGESLVQRLVPQQVVFSAGRYSRFGHPDAEVVRRFRRVGSCLWGTPWDGALTLWLGESGRSRMFAERPPPRPEGGVEGGCLALESPATIPGGRR